MSFVRAIHSPRLSTRRLYRSKTVWLSLLVVGAFLFVACSGGSADTDSQPASGGAANDAQPATRSADAAADFELVLFGNENHTRGEKIRLSQFLGQPVVINFWFPSCPPCVAEMPDLNAAFQKHLGNDVVFIGVQLLGLDSANEGQKFVDLLGVSYALGPDENGDIVKDYGITGFPTTVFLDRNQEVVRKWSGILNLDKIDELVGELLN